MDVLANGKRLDVPSGSTIFDLVARLGLSSRTVAVERNGAAVPRDSFGHVLLEQGDTLEVVRPVQGG